LSCLAASESSVSTHSRYLEPANAARLLRKATHWFICRRSMGGVGYFSAVSNVVQHMLTEVFNDESFMAEYFAENSRRLGAAYAEFTGERSRDHHSGMVQSTRRFMSATGALLHLQGCDNPPVSRS